MQAAFVALHLDAAHVLDVVDVDADQALVSLYDELVPVLVGLDAAGAPRQLCHYFLDEAAVRGFIADVAGSPPQDA